MSDSSMNDKSGETKPSFDDNMVTHVKTSDTLSQTDQDVDSEIGCKPAKYVRALYASGARLWTKDMFCKVEEELAKDPRPASILIRTMDDDFYRQRVGERDPSQERNEPCVFFNMYQQMVFDAARPDQDDNHASKKTLCALGVGWTTKRSSSIEYPKLRAMWDEAQRRWNQSSLCSELIDVFKKSAKFPKTVRKIVCFGLGTLEGDDGRISFHDGQPLRSAMTQHAAAMTLAAAFGELLDTDPLPILVQDPGYSPESRKLLMELGFEVVGGYGSLGFTHVDDDTAVFSCHANICVKQIVVDIAKPAIMIWDRVEPVEKEGPSWTVEVVEGKEVRIPTWCSSLDSPRVHELVESYNRHDWPTERERFGDLEIYIRND